MGSQEVMDGIEPFLYEWTSGHRGSISAEHGLGFKKRNFIHFSKSDSAVFLMQQICRAWPWIQEEKLHPFLQIGLGRFSDEADQAGVRSERHHEPLQSSPGPVNPHHVNQLHSK